MRTERSKGFFVSLMGISVAFILGALFLPLYVKTAEEAEGPLAGSVLSMFFIIAVFGYVRHLNDIIGDKKFEVLIHTSFSAMCILIAFIRPVWGIGCLFGHQVFFYFYVQKLDAFDRKSAYVTFLVTLAAECAVILPFAFFVTHN